MPIGVTIIAVISITLTTLVFLSKKSQVKDSFVYPFIANLLCVTCLHSVSFAMYWFSSDDVNVEGFICDVQSFLMVLTCQSQEIWVIYITLICYQAVVNMKLYNFSQNLFLLVTFIVLGYLVPFTILTILFSIYGTKRNEHYCWINPEEKIPLVFLYIPKIIYIIINLVIWTLLLCRIRQMKKDKKIGEDTKRFGYKTFGFALIELLCNIPSLPLKLIGATDSQYYYLTNISIIISSLQGVAYPFFVGWYTELLCFKNKNENAQSNIPNEKKDDADLSLQTILNSSNSVVEKEINEINNDHLISPSKNNITGRASIDYYN